jgi:hypothetical protein
MTGKLDGVYQYVPHGFVHAFEKLGWVVEPHILRGTHHGYYSDCMRWAGEGEPVFPTRRNEAAA